MSYVADLHNFGQQVKRVARASGSYFQKPRTLFWEWLLFGRTSPLRSVLETDGTDLLFSTVFGLDVEFFGPDFNGAVKEVESRPDGFPALSEDFYHFGALLGYCYAFGVRDLHRSNLVLTKSGLQVIDAEVVFTRLLLPNETLLLPFKDVPFDRCGMGHLVESLSALTIGDVQAILCGYTACITRLADRADPAISAISQAIGDRLEIPIRHIARDTSRYRDWRSAESSEAVPFMTEERVQLERGDIPYFFKYLGRPELWNFTSPKGERAEVDVPVHLSDAVARDSTLPSLLLERSRLLRELLPIGSLFLARKLIPDGWEGRLRIDQGTFLIGTHSQFELNSTSSSYSAIRQRKLVENPAPVR